MSHTIVVIPLRGLHGGKSRLSPVLDPVQRTTMIAALASLVVGAVVKSNVADAIIVVSREPALLSSIELRHPMISLVKQAEESIGLNAALNGGREAALRSNADRLLVVSADLPLLTPVELARMLEIEDDVIIAPDRCGRGTNALSLRGRDRISRFQFQFGPESRRLHVAEASRLGLDHSTFEARGFALDLDTPDDWAMLTPDMQRGLLARQVPDRCSSIEVASVGAMAVLEPA